MRTLDRASWRGGYRLDMAIAVGFTGLAMLELAVSPTFEGTVDPWLVVFVLMQTAFLGFRRQFPFSVHLIASLGLAFQVYAHPRGISTNATLITLYSAVAYGSVLCAWTSVASTAVNIYWVISRFDVWDEWDLISTSVVWTGAAVLGLFARLQQTESEKQTRRLTQPEDEQRSFRQRTVAEERARMSRELHDAVGHSVTGIILLAGALRNGADQPREVREAIQAIERSGTEAMTELEALIGLLRDDGDGDELAPQPTLHNLDRLLSSANAMGLEVDADLGTARSLSPVIDRAAYRVIQESLTNAAKYANPAQASVALRYAPDSIEIEIVNPTIEESRTTILSGGRGLIGMDERLSILGGTLAAGPAGHREFRVRATLPLGPGSGERSADARVSLEQSRHIASTNWIDRELDVTASSTAGPDGRSRLNRWWPTLGQEHADDVHGQWKRR
jgi:signal transduction histidine kinase